MGSRKKQIFYGQSNHKSGPPTPLLQLFGIFFCVCAKKSFFGSKFSLMKLIIEKFYLFISLSRVGVNWKQLCACSFSSIHLNLKKLHLVIKGRDNNWLDIIFLQFFRKKGASRHKQGVGDNNCLHRHWLRCWQPRQAKDIALTSDKAVPVNLFSSNPRTHNKYISTLGPLHS